MIVPKITLRPKRIIVDVDTQRHFFLDGVTRVLKHRRVLANIREIVDWARLENIRMISTVQIYTSNYPYCSFCVAGTEGQRKVSYTLRERRISFPASDCTDLARGVLEQYEQVILFKRCFDPFEEPRVDRMLSELEADEFILIGAITEGAVKATALGLMARRKNVTVVVDATGSWDSSAAKSALRHMWAKGARLAYTKMYCVPLLRTCYCDRG